MLRWLLALIPDHPKSHAGLVGLRDRAVLLVGFAGALRRSELASIKTAQLEATDRRLRHTPPHSKGSQAGAVTVPLPYGDKEMCPVRALERNPARRNSADTEA